MCGLCGMLGGGRHWADGVLAGAELAGSVPPHARRPMRRERTALCNAILQAYGLSLTDWQDTEFLLRNRTGVTRSVDSLTDLWPMAEQLSGGGIDPLDSALLERLDERRRR